MRTSITRRGLLPILAASLLLFSAPFVSAQGQGQGQGRRGGGGGRGGLPNMTEEQTAALQQVNQEIADHAQKVRQARTDLNAAIYAAKVDESDIKAKISALAKAEEDQAIARAKAFAKVRSKFTPEQIDALKSGRGGGGFGGGRGGAGGGARRGNNNAN